MPLADGISNRTETTNERHFAIEESDFETTTVRFTVDIDTCRFMSALFTSEMFQTSFTGLKCRYNGYMSRGAFVISR